MTSGVGIVGPAQGGVVFTPSAGASSTPATTGFSNQLVSAGATSVANIHNPILVNDPAAGIITEYLSANGSEVVSQTPSAVTVAYLRQGLAADGSPKAATGKVTA